MRSTGQRFRSSGGRSLSHQGDILTHASWDQLANLQPYPVDTPFAEVLEEHSKRGNSESPTRTAQSVTCLPTIRHGLWSRRTRKFKSIFAGLGGALVLLFVAYSQVSYKNTEIDGRLMMKSLRGRWSTWSRYGNTPTCTIPVYVDVGIDSYPYLMSTVFGGVHSKCGCHLQPHSLDVLHDAPPGSLVVLSRPTSYHQQAILRSSRGSAFGVFHLNDESSSDNVFFYATVNFTYRNFVRPNVNVDWTYLKIDAQKEVAFSPPQPIARKHRKIQPPVRWLPLGFGPQYRSMPAIRQDVCFRPYLWTYCKDESQNPIGDQAVLESCIGKRDPTVIHQGKVESFYYGLFPRSTGEETNTSWSEYSSPPADDDGSYGKSTAYARSFYDAAFVPCPRGSNAEQSCIWEALDAGAIPIVLNTASSSAELQPLVDLDLAFPALDNWCQFHSFMKSAQDTHLVIRGLSIHLHERYNSIMGSLAKKVAEDVCSLQPTLPGGTTAQADAARSRGDLSNVERFESHI